VGAVAAIFVVLLALMLLIALWRIIAPDSRACPRCGRQVKKGDLECSECGFDFRTIGEGTKNEGT
jgi:hypothetical protein